MRSSAQGARAYKNAKALTCDSVRKYVCALCAGTHYARERTMRGSVQARESTNGNGVRKCLCAPCAGARYARREPRDESPGRARAVREKRISTQKHEDVLGAPKGMRAQGSARAEREERINTQKHEVVLGAQGMRARKA